MSNVLIGIIGVILFIGLALAGALFLGPRFSDSSSTSLGAAMVQSVTQISSAVVYYNTDTATEATVGSDLLQTLVNGRYLKSIPDNPSGGDSLIVLSKNGEASGVIGMVVARMSNVGAEKACGAIVRQTKNGDDTIGADGYSVVVDAASLPSGPAGCFRVGSSAVNALQANQFYAFARL